MKNARKTTAILLAIVMALAITANVHGADYYADAGVTQMRPGHMFAPVTGEVVSVTEGTRPQVRLAVGESFVDFNVSHSTYVHGGFPAVGDTVTGFFDTNTFMIMIYPPQYEAVVLINQENDLPFAFVGRFFGNGDGDELLSADGALRLNVNHPETVIVSQGGQDASDWDLDGRKLVAFYTASTRSLPPLVFAPEKIVVLYEIAVHLPGLVGEWEEEPDDITEIEPRWDDAYTFHDIVINGVGLPGETFTSADGIFPTHVPIRAVAESLGITVDWQAPYVALSGAWGDIRFRSRSNVYYVNGEAVTLSEAPFSVNGRVQVPLEFFSVIAGFNNAWSAGGTVFIDNAEPFE